MHWGVELKMRDYIAFVLGSVLVLVLCQTRVRETQNPRSIPVVSHHFPIAFLSRLLIPISDPRPLGSSYRDSRILSR